VEAPHIRERLDSSLPEQSTAQINVAEEVEVARIEKGR
jgi:hypothetical protein